MKNVLTIFFVAWSLLFGACSDNNFADKLPNKPEHPIIILYENDAHCAIDGYPMLVSLRNECQSQTNYV